MIPPGQAMRRQIWLFPFDWCFHQTRAVVMISCSGRYVGYVPIIIIIYSNQSSGMVIHQLVWAQWLCESICPQIPPPSLRKLYHMKNFCLFKKSDQITKHTFPPVSCLDWMIQFFTCILPSIDYSPFFIICEVAYYIR